MVMHSVVILLRHLIVVAVITSISCAAVPKEGSDMSYMAARKARCLTDSFKTIFRLIFVIVYK